MALEQNNGDEDQEVKNRRAAELLWLQRTLSEEERAELVELFFSDLSDDQKKLLGNVIQKRETGGYNEGFQVGAKNERSNRRY